MLEIIVNHIPESNKNRPKQPNPMKYITIHETGNTSAGADALRHASFLNNGGGTAGVSYHYTVDDKRAVQHLPHNETAFHAGDGRGAGNTQSIGIEIAVNSDGSFSEATGNAAFLTAMLMEKHDIPLENIRRHFDWSGKNCPQRLMSNSQKGWMQFLELVKAYSETHKLIPEPGRSDEQLPAPAPWAEKAWQWGIETGITDGNRPAAPATRQETVQMLYRYAVRMP